MHLDLAAGVDTWHHLGRWGICARGWPAGRRSGGLGRVWAVVG